MSLLQDSSLLLTPSAYKEGKLYSVIPSNGNGDFTATRATTATRVNAEGLVELVPYNLLTYSEMFSDASWVKQNATIDANVGIAPNGTLTADRLTATANLGAVIQSSTQTIQIYTQSVWVKSESGTVSGSIFGISSTATKTDFVATTEWQRITNTQLSLGFNRFPQIRLDTAGTSILVWGAQLVEGTSARDYLRTETRLNIPRVDYSLGGCPNILLEPQRTNLALQSSSFDSATWIKFNTTQTANTTTSPSGIVDADTMTGNGTTTQKGFFQSIAVTNAVTYTISIYAKKNTNNFIQIGGGDSFAITSFANFNLDTGVLGTVGATASATITNAGNGWYRCTMTATTIFGSTTSIAYRLVSSATAASGESNNLSTSVFLWGAQLEAGAYATSYIPTTTASVTRNLDVVQDTGVSSLIGQTEGTIYWEGTLTSGLDDIFSLNRSTANSVVLYKSATNTIVFRVYYGASFLSIGNATSYTGFVKIAAAYKSGSSVLYINGVQAGTSATAFTFTGALNDVVLNNTAFFFGNQTKSVKELALFQTRLTNAQLAALTA